MKEGAIRSKPLRNRRPLVPWKRGVAASETMRLPGGFPGVTVTLPRKMLATVPEVSGSSEFSPNLLVLPGDRLGHSEGVGGHGCQAAGGRLDGLGLAELHQAQVAERGHA